VHNGFTFTYLLVAAAVVDTVVDLHLAVLRIVPMIYDTGLSE